MPDHMGRTYTLRYYSGEALVSMKNMIFADDHEAIELAKEAQFGFGLEIWDDGRLVFASRDGQLKPPGN